MMEKFRALGYFVGQELPEKRIRVTSNKGGRRIVSTSKRARTISPEEVAKALGAERISPTDRCKAVEDEVNVGSREMLTPEEAAEGGEG